MLNLPYVPIMAQMIAFAGYQRLRLGSMMVWLSPQRQDGR